MIDFNARLKKLLNGAIWKTLESCQNPELNQELSTALDELIILAESEHEALLKLEQQFALFIKLAEMCPSFLWIADSDGMLEYASERWMEFSGATEEQTLGTGWMDFIDERDREKALAEWKSALQNTRTFELITRFKSGLDGSSRWFLARGVPLTDEKGGTIKWFGSTTDIHTQKTLKEELATKVEDLSRLIEEYNQSQEKLVESENLFQVVCETSSHLIITSDEDGAVEYCNQRWKDYVGLSLRDGTGKAKSWLKIIHSDDRLKFDQQWQKARERDMPLEVEVRLKDKDGNYLWHLLCGMPIKCHTGKRWCITCTDVEAHYDLLSSLSRAKEAAEEASKLKSSFVANISHELRTPLNGVLGMTQLLRTLTLPEPADDYLNVIEEAGQSLLTVINDVLDFSKMEAGKMELVEEDVSLAATIDSATNILATQAEFKELFFLSYVDKRIPEILKGDGQRVKQVLLNLLSNAIKFTEIGGVFVSVTLVGRSQDESTVRFSILDSGIGVPPELQQELFKPFIQADLSIGRKYGGTGLGLSISKNLVELLGGKLTVLSELGNGSEFSFTLKLKNHKKETPIDPSDPAEIPFNRRRIIVTGRSKHMIDRLAKCLSMTGHKVEAITSLSDWCDLMKEIELGADGYETYHISLGKAPKRWMKNTSEKALKRIRRQVIIQDPLTRQEDEEALRNASVIKLNCPVKVWQILQALDGIKSQSISGGQQVVPLQPASQSQRNYTRSREFSKAGSESDENLERPKKAFKALIADDNPINLRVSRLLLSQFGLEVDAAVSGFEALEKAKINDYDIIFLDCQMPQMDGFETCKRIKLNQAKQGKWAPVIAVTANSFSVVKESYSRSGMDDFLPKPILSENLLNLLSKWLDTEDNNRSILRQPHYNHKNQTRNSGNRIMAITSFEQETTEADYNNNNHKQLRPDLLLSRYGTEYAQLLKMFQESAREHIESMTLSLKAGQLEETAKQAHGFKGVCGTICSAPLEALSKRLEMECKSKQTAAAENTLTELNEQLQIMLTEISEHLLKQNNQNSNLTK